MCQYLLFKTKVISLQRYVLDPSILITLKYSLSIKMRTSLLSLVSLAAAASPALAASNKTYVKTDKGNWFLGFDNEPDSPEPLQTWTFSLFNETRWSSRASINNQTQLHFDDVSTLYFGLDFDASLGSNSTLGSSTNVRQFYTHIIATATAKKKTTLLQPLAFRRRKTGPCNSTTTGFIDRSSVIIVPILRSLQRNFIGLRCQSRICHHTAKKSLSASMRQTRIMWQPGLFDSMRRHKLHLMEITKMIFFKKQDMYFGRTCAYLLLGLRYGFQLIAFSIYIGNCRCASRAVRCGTH